MKWAAVVPAPDYSGDTACAVARCELMAELDCPGLTAGTAEVACPVSACVAAVLVLYIYGEPHIYGEPRFDLRGLTGQAGDPVRVQCRAGEGRDRQRASPPGWRTFGRFLAETDPGWGRWRHWTGVRT